MPAMGESRQELLAWLNGLLQLNITKVEQCGTGAALCQLYDSIFLDIPMSRVKFNVNTEYAYIQNFKILQNCFTKHGIDRTVPVESLVKCKMQDNLEFLQWSKRFWDQYFPGHEYDAVARRKGAGAPAGGAHITVAPTAAITAGTSRTSTSGTSTTRKTGATPVTRTGGARVGSGGSGGYGGASAALLKQENEQLKEAIADLEKERDFYFSKLRDIELLLQTAVEQDPALEEDENGLVKNIQTILYSTEEGFEIPDVDANGEAEGEEPETF
ncbi:microtubule integrity protein mal3 [Exophiala dermatitidis]|uniref:Microtubule integrity protein mal3 n=1 Tax=Exophiala dermatitidis TaxID=5970 RepID=A0AAN6EW00_EXODE|nr:microtubule integrity protein mal3 [Exophiala dermatitidis]KAJ4521385.1 microtubule integrity protein mal3 [Exophiala dermatitidis]KAJ4542058.1 microtubule integrity protein mal3 [Exophiala dermatitidis]KAJ4544823.1 microtubule integrity protein mal3 [Exophiala dermatitidis]KAJ4565298.1 microtubule integrity protein mal3 [Exophiala dermatitidis]